MPNECEPRLALSGNPLRGPPAEIAALGPASIGVLFAHAHRAFPPQCAPRLKNRMHRRVHLF